MQAPRGGTSSSSKKRFSFALRRCVVPHVLCRFVTVLGLVIVFEQKAALAESSSELVGSSRPGHHLALRRHLQNASSSVQQQQQHGSGLRESLQAPAAAHVVERRTLSNGSRSNASRLHADSAGHLVEVSASAGTKVFNARTAAAAWLSTKEAQVRTLSSGAQRLRDARLELEDEISALSSLTAQDPTLLQKAPPATWRPPAANASAVGGAAVAVPGDGASKQEERQASAGAALAPGGLKRSLVRRSEEAAATARGSGSGKKVRQRRDQDPACCNRAGWRDADGRDCDWYGENIQQCDNDARMACCICHLGRRPDQSCSLSGSSV